MYYFNRMGKVIKTCFGITFFIVFLLAQFHSLRASFQEVIDQSCSGTTSRSEVIGGGGHIIYQSFKPRYEYLTKISVLLNTDGVGEAKLTVLTKDDHKIVATKTLAEQSGREREYSFDLNSTKMMPGQEYLLIVEPTVIENEGLSWYYVQNESGSCYPDGMITAGVIDPKVDMRFATYGYNAELEEITINKNSSNQKAELGSGGKDSKTKEATSAENPVEKTNDSSPNVVNNKDKTAAISNLFPQAKGVSSKSELLKENRYILFEAVFILILSIMIVRQLIKNRRG